MNPRQIVSIGATVVGIGAALGDFVVAANVSHIIGPVGISDGVDNVKFVEPIIHSSGTRTTTICVALVITQYQKREIKMEVTTEAVVLALSGCCINNRYRYSHQVVMV